MFSGIHAVLYALFRADESIDPGAMARQVIYCVDRECDGVTVPGLATEVLKLTQAERRQIVEITSRALDGCIPFSVTIAGNSATEQVEMVRIAETNGADWLILQPPMAGSYEAEVYLDFFARVAAATDLPVAIQNAPQYLGRSLSPSDIARLRDRCPNLAAIKAEDSTDELAAIIEIAGEDLAILSGRGGQEMTDCLRAGVKGFVLAPDIAPVAVRILDHWNSGRTEEAESLYAAALPAIAFSMQSLEHLVTYGKRIFAAQAGLNVHDRSPALTPKATDLDLADHWSTILRRLTG